MSGYLVQSITMEPQFVTTGGCSQPGCGWFRHEARIDAAVWDDVVIAACEHTEVTGHETTVAATRFTSMKVRRVEEGEP